MENNIKEMVLGFKNAIDNLNPKRKKQKVVRDTLISSFKTIMECILPNKFFVCCDTDTGYEGENIKHCAQKVIYIFDEERECWEWITKNKHLYNECEKITFKEFKEISDNFWGDYENYFGSKYDFDFEKFEYLPLKYEVYFHDLDIALGFGELEDKYDYGDNDD